MNKRCDKYSSLVLYFIQTAGTTSCAIVKCQFLNYHFFLAKETNFSIKFMFVCEQTVVISKSAAKLSLKSWVLDLSYCWIFKCLLIFIINYLQEYFIQVYWIMNLYLHKDKNARQATAIYVQRSSWRQWLLELNTPPLYGTIDLKNNCFFVTFCLWAIL